MASKTKITNIRGREGIQGPQGDQGLAGVNGVDNATAVAGYIDTDAGVRASLGDFALPLAKKVEGGNFPKPVRASVLTVEESFPSGQSPYDRILWTENNGVTLYATGNDRTIRKSTNSGRTWTARGYISASLTVLGNFLKLSTGTLLTMNASFSILRSTDDGLTWATVAAPRADTLPLGTQSWAVDTATGYIYYGEYSVGQADVTLWRSVDDGLTWTAFYVFPGPTSGHVDQITHIHAVQWDHIAARIVICTGDSSDATGLYRVTADGTSVEPLLTNRMLDASLVDAPRAIGIMPFPDYIVWASDSTANPFLFRMARSQIGLPSPVIEKGYRTNSTSWFTVRASSDGTRWVFASSQENSTTRLDKLIHLYAVEDQGATVYEIGAIAPTDDTLPAGSLMPVGLPEMHGDRFFMLGRTMGRNAVWKFRLGYGTTGVQWPALPEIAPIFTTANSGSVVIPAGASVVFGVTRAPSYAAKLQLFDAGGSVQEGGSGDLRVDVRVKGAAYTYRTQGTPSARATRNLYMGNAMEEYAFSPSADLEFVAVNAGTGSITCVAFVTYGFAG